MSNAGQRKAGRALVVSDTRVHGREVCDVRTAHFSRFYLPVGQRSAMDDLHCLWRQSSESRSILAGVFSDIFSMFVLRLLQAACSCNVKPCVCVCLCAKRCLHLTCCISFYCSLLFVTYSNVLPQLLGVNT